MPEEAYYKRSLAVDGFVITVFGSLKIAVGRDLYRVVYHLGFLYNLSSFGTAKESLNNFQNPICKGLRVVYYKRSLAGDGLFIMASDLGKLTVGALGLQSRFTAEKRVGKNLISAFVKRGKQSNLSAHPAPGNPPPKGVPSGSAKDLKKSEIGVGKAGDGD